MKVCAVIQRNVCPDHQASATVKVNFLDIGEQVTGPWCSPYEISGNERADQKAKSPQPQVPLTLRNKNIISTFTDKYTTVTPKLKSLGKLWETLATEGSIPRHLERAKAVAHFRLTTGHDFLGVYLHWLDLAADEACPLCDHARMDGDHLLQCTRLDEYSTDDIVSR
ncbi:reverse transcriptase [Trichonephila clavipes]|nr:reverse transcriptase [Trichonephila clavipes]